MIIHKGDIVKNVKQGYILQQVNCMGVMGSGVAKAIRAEYPKVYTQYRVFWNNQDKLSDLMGAAQTVKVSDELEVVNLFGQYSYGQNIQHTDYDSLKSALYEFNKFRDISKPIHHPMIGAGLGAGDWNIISAMIEEILGTETNLWVLE